MPTDQSFKLPDEVWALPESERSTQCNFTTDFGHYNKSRLFIRCLLKVPFIESAGYFGWGVWVDVEVAAFNRYMHFWEADGTAEPPIEAALANVLPGYDEKLGAELLVQFGEIKQRPSVILPKSSLSRLALEQRQGIDSVRYHEILELL